ncbi:MAG TPA: M1 family aminopeptidase [Gemmataceae bacterium]|nr:M1 family aminopeptidase [Gemmataceae bacterium]
MFHPRTGGRGTLGLLALILLVGSAQAAPSPYLPRYYLDIQLDTAQHTAVVHQRIAWTNRHQRQATEVVLNAHSHYQLPDKDVGMTAKIFEILRMMPSESLDFEGHALSVRKVRLMSLEWAEDTEELGQPRKVKYQPGTETILPPPRTLRPLNQDLSFHYQEGNDSALVVPLPRPVRQGETITLDLEFVLKLPNTQGRWGYWQGITFLTNWLPVLAFYDDKGWQPTPYVCWHQPFYNEAGFFTVRLTTGVEQHIACTAPVLAERDLGNGWRQVDFAPCCVRDFAIVCSARFREFTGQCGDIKIRCLAAPENEHYARFMVESAKEALTVYARWFGPYPYPQFTIVESYFGWNSNECAGLIMIDSRIFGMPHLAKAFIDYLVAQATCHQWWYNVVGTHGYSETWMDEGLATYFAYRLMKVKYGPQENLVNYPKGLKWLPNVRRSDYRYFNLYGTLARGEAQPTVQDIPKYGHIVDLYSMCYERGSKVVGMIEHELGEQVFFDFMRFVYRRHAFGILRVADFQRDLEEFTHKSWQTFFQHWVYGAGMSDWCVEKVTVQPLKSWRAHRPPPIYRSGSAMVRSWFRPKTPCKVTVILHQKAEYTDPTVVGFCLDGGESFQIRVPVIPEAGMIETTDPPGYMETLDNNRVKVEVELPSWPTQIAVDPDQILVDSNPVNNYWKTRFRFRATPVYTFLNETDLTNDYDRWNLIFGPWIFAPTYDNPWFTRSTRFGVRAGGYRTAAFDGGAYAAYRTDYRDFVAGVDAVFDHWPWPHTEAGFVFEHRLAGTLDGESQANRGVVYGRYVIDYGDSLYLPPFQYVESFATIQDDLLPFARESVVGADRFKHQGMGGVHYHINYLTPYWNPEGGFSADLSYAAGLVLPGVNNNSTEPNRIFGIDGSHQLLGQATYVQAVPDGLGWFSSTVLAFRLYGAFGLPNNVQYFALGGSELFRGFDLAQRQGNSLWVGSVEWRVPVLRNLNWAFFDRALSLRGIYAAAFCDVGDVMLRGQSIGGVSEAVGAGLRLDLSWFTFVERTILRVDAAKTVNSQAPMQIWTGIEHPF